MMELVDRRPDVRVLDAEYTRLLGYPPHHALSDRAAELAGAAREWYAQHGRPWVYAREIADVAVEAHGVRMEGSMFHGQRLRDMLEQADARGVMLGAVSAGPEAEEEAQRLWRDEKPDEYFFLETYASAVTEQLTMDLGVRLCAWAETHGNAILPHDSPGYSGWSIAEQPRLVALLKGELPGALEVLESGALRPKKSLVAVFGIAADAASLYRLRGGVPCIHCSHDHCQFRRAAYSQIDTYTVNQRALERWARERLHLRYRADGGIDARFRYDGSTCTNIGRPVAFEYTVTLGTKEEGYPLLDQQCRPIPGDTGHFAMCKYSPELMRAIEDEKPLAGRPLADTLAWRRPSGPAGCYCDAASRDHKWGLVLETIHYALSKKL